MHRLFYPIVGPTIRNFQVHVIETFPLIKDQILILKTNTHTVALENSSFEAQRLVDPKE